MNKDGIEVSDSVSYNSLLHKSTIWIQKQGLDITIGFRDSGKAFCDVYRESELLHSVDCGIEVENVLRTCQWVYTH